MPETETQQTTMAESGQATQSQTQGGQTQPTTQTQETKPSVSLDEVLGLRSKYEQGLSGLTAKQKELQAEAEKLAPFRSLAERMEQAKEHPDLLVELLEQQTGKSFQELAKAVASRNPTSPEAVQALTEARKMRVEIEKMRHDQEAREVLAEVRPALSDSKVAKFFELEDIKPETIVAGVRHLRSQGQQVDVADVVQKHAGYIRAKTLKMLEADPSILEDALKARDEAKAKAEAAEKAKSAPPRAIPQGAQQPPASGVKPRTEKERTAAAVAVLRGGK